MGWVIYLAALLIVWLVAVAVVVGGRNPLGNDGRDDAGQA